MQCIRQPVKVVSNTCRLETSTLLEITFSSKFKFNEI